TIFSQGDPTPIKPVAPIVPVANKESWPPPITAPTPAAEPIVSMPSSEAAEIDTHAPEGLATTNDHKLVINRALRDVCDYFLLTESNQHNADRCNRLLA